MVRLNTVFAEDLPDLRLQDLDRPITLDNRADAQGRDEYQLTVSGKLVGVLHYLDDQDRPCTQVRVQLFGGHVIELAFVAGSLSEPVPPADPSESPSR